MKDAFGVEISKSKKALAAGVGVSVVGSVIANQLPQNSKGKWKLKNKAPVSKSLMDAGAHKPLSQMSSRQLSQWKDRLKTGATPVKSMEDRIFDSVREGRKKGFTATDDAVAGIKSRANRSSTPSGIKNVSFDRTVRRKDRGKVIGSFKGQKFDKPVVVGSNGSRGTGVGTTPGSPSHLNINPQHIGNKNVATHESAHIKAQAKKPGRAIRNALSPRWQSKIAGEEGRADAAMKVRGALPSDYPTQLTANAGQKNYHRVYTKITGRTARSKTPELEPWAKGQVDAADARIITSNHGFDNTFAERIKQGARVRSNKNLKNQKPKLP
jgi:hypothetical protein